jgi:DNA/RNA-binding domain of Phe-tRNA-synthetase-like protein
MKTEKDFIVEKAVKDLGLRGIYLIMNGLRNTAHNSEFDVNKETKIKSILEQLTEETIEGDQILQGFRDLHTMVKKSNRKNVASPENLFKLVLKNQTLPHVNLLVDIYNLVSLETRLALGAHDLHKVEGNIHLRLTNGNEKFLPLGASETKPVGQGEYAYVDDSNEIICYLEVRQIEKTKVTLESTDCFYIIQGNQNTSPEYLEKAANRLVELTKRYCGGVEKILARVW